MVVLRIGTDAATVDFRFHDCGIPGLNRDLNGQMLEMLYVFATV